MKKKNLLLTAIAIFGLATITMAQVPNYVPINGLVGWWPFNGNANDESGNGNNGSVNGATLTTDRYGNANSAYSFNGSSDYISTQNGINTVNSITYSAWINTAIGGYIISQGSETGGFELFLHTPSSGGIHVGKACFYQSISGGGFGKMSNNLYDDSQWHHIVGVLYGYTTSNLNPDSVKLYIDGQIVAQSNVTTVSGYIPSTPNHPFWFGCLPNFLSNSYVNGELDDIGIWNRALTQQEITNLYIGCQLSVTTQPNSQIISINNNAQLIVNSSDANATYQWQTDLGVGFQNLNSVGQYSGTTNDTLTVSNVTMSNNNQPFRCIVTSGSCSDTSNVAVLTVNNNVGINETSQDNLFSVFPNPAQSVINVNADSKLIGSVYSIYDNTGKVVLSGKLNAESTTIELGSLSGGIYMFSIGENLKQTFKVIKE